MTPLKLALSVAINHYPYKSNWLNGCLNDSQNWCNILRNKFGFSFQQILDNQATKNNVVTHLQNLLDDTQSGDLIVFQFSGHGCKIPCNVGETNCQETDDSHESLVLFDSFLIDYEIANILANLKTGVKFIAILDSCFSSNATRSFQSFQNDFIMPRNQQCHKFPVIPFQKRNRIFTNKNMSHILFAACGENETASDAIFNGIYQGAFSHYAIQTINENPILTNESFMVLTQEKMQNSIHSNQHCNIECNQDSKNKPLFV